MTPSYFHFFISKRNALFCVFVSVFLLSACQTVHDTLDSFDPTTMTIARWDKRPDTLSSDMCPDIEIMPELGTIIRFSDPSAPSLETMRTRVDINRAERTCIMNEKTMQVDLSLFFAGRLMQGQQGTGPAGYPFFVAIVSPGGSVLAKEVFSASLSMNGPNSSVHEEKMRHLIPIENETHGARYRIKVGFQLSPQQLAFNRYLIDTYADPEQSTQQAQDRMEFNQ